MTYLGISTIAMVVLTAVCAWGCNKATTDGWGAFLFVLGIFSGFCSFFSCIALAFLGYDWYAAGYKTQIINREYGTNYTREEVFYAKDVIDTIQEINRKRIEINGNLMQNKCPENTNVVADEVNASF